MEIIDSTDLTVLGEIQTINEEIDGNYTYQIGVLNENVLIRMHSGATGNILITFLYERANHSELTARTAAVFAGKLAEMKVEHFSIKKNGDALSVTINETFPHTSFEPITKFHLNNNRQAAIDGRERAVWNLYLSVESGKLLLAEMKRIENQIAEQ